MRILIAIVKTVSLIGVLCYLMSCVGSKGVTSKTQPTKSPMLHNYSITCTNDTIFYNH